MKKSIIVIWVVVGLLVVAGASVIAYHMGKSSQCAMNVAEPSATPIVTATSVPSVTSSAAPKATATSGPIAEFKGEFEVGAIQYNSDKDVYVIMGLEAIETGVSPESSAIIYKYGDAKSVVLKPTDKVTDYNGNKVTMAAVYKDYNENADSAFNSYQIIYNTADKSFGINE